VIKVVLSQLHLAPLALFGVGVVFLLIAVDVALAYLRALLSDRWDWAKAGQFVARHVFPKIGGLLVTAWVSQIAHGGFPGVISTGMLYGGILTVAISLVKDILGKLQAFALVHPSSSAPTTGGSPGGSA